MKASAQIRLLPGDHRLAKTDRAERSDACQGVAAGCVYLFSAAASFHVAQPVVDGRIAMQLGTVAAQGRILRESRCAYLEPAVTELAVTVHELDVKVGIELQQSSKSGVAGARGP